MTISKLAAWAMSTAVASIVLGCGGSAGLSRSRLATEANSICRTAQAAAKAVPQPEPSGGLVMPKTRFALISPYFEKIAPITATETSQLEKLKADSSASSDWKAFIAAQQAADRLLETIVRKAKASDVSGLHDLAQVPNAGQRVATAAAKLGAGVCAQ